MELKETYCKTQYDRKAFLSFKFFRGRLTVTLDSDRSGGGQTKGVKRQKVTVKRRSDPTFNFFPFKPLRKGSTVHTWFGQSLFPWHPVSQGLTAASGCDWGFSSSSCMTPFHGAPWSDLDEAEVILGARLFFGQRERKWAMVKQMEGDVPNWKSDSQVIDRVDARARDLGVDRGDPWCTHKVEN